MNGVLNGFLKGTFLLKYNRHNIILVSGVLTGFFWWQAKRLCEITETGINYKDTRHTVWPQKPLRTQTSGKTIKAQWGPGQAVFIPSSAQCWTNHFSVPQFLQP